MSVPSHQDLPVALDSVLSAESVTRINRYSSPRSAPNGSCVAFIDRFDGLSTLHTVSIDGQTIHAIVNDFPMSGSDFDWMPNSSSLVYLSGSTFILVSLDGSNSRVLCDFADEPSMLSIAPSGEKLVYISAGQRVCIFDLKDSHSSVQISSGPSRNLSPRWLSDSSGVVWVAYDERKMPWDESRIVMWRPPDHREHVIAAMPDHAHTQPTPSVDTQYLAYLQDLSGFTQLSILDLDKRHLLPLPDEHVEHGGPAWPFDVRDVAWSPDSKRLVHTTNNSANIGLDIVTVDTHHRALLSRVSGTHSQPTWCGSNYVVCAYSSSTQPTQIVRLDVDLGDRLVLIGDTLSQPVVAPTHNSYPSTKDAASYALLSQPQSPKPLDGFPLLVHFHGGPTDQATNQWDGAVQLFVSLGWMVAQVNYRGSSGYGKAYKDSLYGHWGLREVADAAAVVDQLIENGMADRRKIVAWGGSAGGYAVLHALTADPNRYAAGVCLYGISDLLRLAETSSGFEQFYVDSLVGPLPKSKDMYQQLSPLTHVDKLVAPLLILHGGRDTDVPIDQAEHFIAALNATNKRYEYHVYPDEGHGWRRHATQLDYLDRMLTFIKKWVT